MVTICQLSGTGPISLFLSGSPRVPSLKSLCISAFFSSTVSAINRSCLATACWIADNTVAIWRCSAAFGEGIGSSPSRDFERFGIVVTFCRPK